MTADARDRITLEHAPLVAMPRYTNFPPLEVDGHRFITAEDGLWLEVKRSWLRLTWPIAESAIALPYGPVLADEYTFAFSDHELAYLVDRFMQLAREALPDECAAWGVWDEKTQRLELRPCIAIEAAPGGVSFHRPVLEPHEHLAVDIHSHGELGAFFSATDDEDDRGEVKLSIVVGKVAGDAPQVAMRLCALGLFITFGCD